MPRSNPQPLELNNFAGGLNTEASPLNFPPNSTVDEQNLLINKDGSRKRRNGLELQRTITGDFGEPPAGQSDFAVNSINDLFMDSVSLTNGKEGSSGDPYERYTIVNLGYVTGIGLIEKEGGSVQVITDINANTELKGIPNSKGRLSGSIAQLGTTLVFPNFNPDFDPDGRSYSSLGVYDLDAPELPSVFAPKVRDLWGSIGVNELEKEKDRYLTIEGYSSTGDSWDGTLESQAVVNHIYNLINGTWPVYYRYRDRVSGGSRDIRIPFLPTVESFLDPPTKSYYPALSDNFWAYTADATGADNNQIDSRGSFVLDLYEGQAVNKELEPVKGKILIDPLFRSTSRYVSLNKLWTSSLEEVNSASKINVDFGPDVISSPNWSIINVYNPDIDRAFYHSVTSHLGRVWFVAGDVEKGSNIASSPDVAATVFFSQVVKEKNQAARCYSESSPTSEDFEGIPDTSGGFIELTGATSITKLLPLKDSVIVIADNGIWQIDGGESPFSANNFQIQKLSTTGTSYANSIVSSGDKIFFWAEGGIYQIEQDAVSLQGVSNNISYSTINKLVQSVQNPEAISGAYDKISGEVRWLFCEKDYYVNFRHPSSEVIYDTVTQTFSLNRFPVGGNYPRLLGYIERDRQDRTDTDRGSSLWIVGVSEGTSSDYVAGLYDFTNENYVDFEDIGGGEDAKAYMVGAYQTFGDTQRNKQANYLTCSFKRTEDGFEGSEATGWNPTNPSGCLMQTQWEWTSSVGAGKWGKKQQVYRLPRLWVPEDPATDDWSDFAYTVISSKTKLRGSGKALSIKFESEPGKDMHLYGISTTVDMNGAV